jgi:hypothetical protein
MGDFLIADIAGAADELDAGLFDFVYGRVQHLVVVMQGDICASLRKCDCHAGSETLSGSGNQRVFTFETEEIENCHDIAPLFERTESFCFVKSIPAWVKVRIAEEHPSGAKARDHFCCLDGTTKVVP